MPRGTNVAGQGLQRREILRVIGVAALASHFPGFTRWAYAGAHAAGDAAPPKPERYTPQFFTEPDFAVVSRLTELIIPSDETPGAREAGVCEFVDFMVARDPEQQSPMRTGLTWLQTRSQRDLARPFLALTTAEQVALLESLAYKAKYRADEEEAREFFRRIRELTVMGFYSSEIGYRELDNPALQFHSESPACPHVDDPAHKHLPAAKW
jgi:gluconate 2-dehydrogenase gamma chain